jgi:hypothetical protein
MTHSPGLTGWFDRASEDYQTEARRALGEMREWLAAARPDVVALSNDHPLNWPIDNTPEYTVGIGAEHVGPAVGGWRSTSTGSPAVQSRPLPRQRGRAGARPRLAVRYGHGGLERAGTVVNI